jgi:2'-5' RNA ligase
MVDDTGKSLRLFYALWPDDATREALMRLQAPLHGRKTHYRNLHMTLAFLGQQSADVLPALKKILDDLPRAQISLVVDRIGYFTQNRIAWAGTHDVPAALVALQRDLAQRLAQNNIVFDDRSNFRPHVTLARDTAPPEELPFEPFVWNVDHVALVESVTDRDGVVYRVIGLRQLT